MKTVMMIMSDGESFHFILSIFYCISDMWLPFVDLLLDIVHALNVLINIEKILILLCIVL